MPAEEALLQERIDALEEQIEELHHDLERATNRDLPLLKAILRSILDADSEPLDDFPAAGRALNQRIEGHNERLKRLEAQLDIVTRQSDASTKAEKITAVLAFAQNKADGSGKTAVMPAEIRGCTGVSRRYGYDLVDAIAADVEGTDVREARTVQTAQGPKQKQKALLVDCDQVHGLEEAVNKFTTPGGGSGES